MSIPEDWRFKNECFPFISDEKRCIVVESAYETPGIDKEARLAEARTYGVFKLLKFFNINILKSRKNEFRRKVNKFCRRSIIISKIYPFIESLNSGPRAQRK